MFGRKKTRELEKRLLDVEREYAYQAEKIKLLQEQAERLERRCSAQAKDFDEKLCLLNRKIAELEEKAKQSYDELNEKARATDKDRDSEKAVPMSQVMDEWFNGKKAGEN